MVPAADAQSLADAMNMPSLMGEVRSQGESRAVWALSLPMFNTLSAALTGQDLEAGAPLTLKGIELTREAEGGLKLVVNAAQGDKVTHSATAILMSLKAQENQIALSSITSTAALASNLSLGEEISLKAAAAIVESKLAETSRQRRGYPILLGGTLRKISFQSGGKTITIPFRVAGFYLHTQDPADQAKNWLQLETHVPSEEVHKWNETSRFHSAYSP